VGRMSQVRAAARFVFRNHPEIAREASGAFERRRLNALNSDDKTNKKCPGPALTQMSRPQVRWFIARLFTEFRKGYRVAQWNTCAPIVSAGSVEAIMSKSWRKFRHEWPALRKCGAFAMH